MQKISLLFESSPWFVALCVVAGIVYATILYYKVQTPWSKTINYSLFGLRFLLAFLISLLLVGPLVKQVFNTFEPPTFVIAVDNSMSIKEIEDSLELETLKNNIKTIKSSLENNDYQVVVRTLGKEATDVDSIAFDHQQTNLNDMLSDIQNDYESRNLAEVVLFSDGIFNQGSNPTFKPYPYTIHTVGLGDTITKPDLILNNIIYNKLAYQGNKFPIVAEIFANGFENESMQVNITHRGEVIESRRLEITNNNQYFEEQFLIEATEKGYQQYQVSIQPKQGELTNANNTKQAFVDVIEGKEKILIAAAAPHPDIKALKLAIESNENYEVETFIFGIDEEPDDKFDAYILHQIPNLKSTHRALLDRINDEKLSAWYILGPQSNIDLVNRQNPIVSIQLLNRESDNVFPQLNENFGAFNFEEENSEVIRKYPPVSVPFGNFNLKGEAEILLYQKVGSIVTQKPLLAVSSRDQKSAIMIGSGMWQWRIAEYAQNENTKVFDELVTKTIQFLSAKEDRRKFKVYPVKNEFLDNEPVIFETEVYNDIYERIYGHSIDLKITNEDGNSTGYKYITTEANSTYRINNLEKGTYTYEASSTINGEPQIARGSFAVKDMQIENTILTANHNLLRNLARDNRGEFYQKDGIQALQDNLSTLKAQSVIHTQEDYLSIINIKWLFFLLLVLFSIEWFLRKYHGSY